MRQTNPPGMAATKTSFGGPDSQTGDAATLWAVQKSQLIAWFTPNGHFLDANANFLRETGFALEDLVGRPHFTLLSNSEDENVVSWKDLCIGQVESGEYRIIGTNGYCKWIEAVHVPVPSETGQIAKVGLFAFDISARKSAKSDSGDQMAAITKSHAVIEFDLEGYILSANENFLKIVGYELKEIQGRHHRLFVEEEEANSEFYANFWRQLRKGTFQAGAFLRRTKQRKPVWFQASYCPICNEQGDVTRIVKYATDITNTKAKSDDLQNQIKALSHSQMTIELALDGTIITANKNFLSTFGYNLAEVKGQHHRMFVGTQEADSEAYRKFWERLASGQFQSATYKRIAKGGDEVWIQASYNPILDNHGRPFKVVKFATDVTEAHSKTRGASKRNRSTRQVLEAGTKLAAALVRQSITNAPNGMALLDARGTFVHVNMALCDLLGRVPQELLGQRLDDVLASGFSPLAAQELIALQKGKARPIQEERQLRRKDGSEIWVMLHLTHEKNCGDDETALVLQVQNISERHAAQQLKIDFIATVSHELRTPLTSIKGALGLALANKQVNLDPKLEKLVSIAMKNSERLSLLVNDLLDMEKLSSGQAQFRLSDFSLNSLLVQAISINQPYGMEFGIEFTLSLPPLDTWVRGDTDRLHQVVSNLLSNATKFSPRGSQVRVGITRAEGNVRVGIIDAGPGVPENFRNKIFQPFSQADNSETRPKGGTGLGLNISRQIISRLGGEIGYQNLAAGGCEFWFTIPTIKAPGMEEPTRLAEATKLETARILHIEPDGDFAEVFGTALSDHFEVTRVPNLDEGSQLLKTLRFDAIVVDWNENDREVIAFSQLLDKLQPNARLIGLCSEDRMSVSVGEQSFIKSREEISRIIKHMSEILA